MFIEIFMEVNLNYANKKLRFLSQIHLCYDSNKIIQKNKHILFNLSGIERKREKNRYLDYTISRAIDDGEEDRNGFRAAVIARLIHFNVLSRCKERHKNRAVKLISPTFYLQTLGKLQTS